MPGIPWIDKQTEQERKRIIDALLEAGPEPDYRGLVAKLKLGCSHSALWRYHVDKVKPRLALALKEQAKAKRTNSHQDTGDSEQTQKAVERAAKDETKLLLAADPILGLWDAQRSRLERTIERVMDSDRIDDYARLESVMSKNIEGTAKTVQHPGWSTQATHSTTNTMVVVMPNLRDVQQRVNEAEVIDIDVVADRR